MKKLLLICLSFFTFTSGISSQTLADAIKMTTNEQYESADKLFKQLAAKDPNNGEIYFYQGENYFHNDNIAMAEAAYKKGIEVNATNPLCYIGIGKVLWVQGKQEEAKTNFYKATTFADKKNSTVPLKIAEVYITSETKDLQEALKLIDKAEAIDNKNPMVYIIKGDLYLEQNGINATPAMANYEIAESLDKSSVIAVLRQGKVYYRARNYNLALDYYKKANAIDSSFAPAYREKAEIYFKAGKYNYAVDNYKRYLELNNDCSARGRYSGFLNQAKNYKESIDEAVKALECDPDNAYLYRYKGHSEYEAKEYVNGLVSMKKFFELAESNKALTIIPEDYDYLAKLYAENNNDSMAIVTYEKELKMVPEKAESINRELATLYFKSKNYTKSVEVFKLNIDKGTANVNDYLGLGRAYFSLKEYKNADTAFMKVTELLPDKNYGYLWRAKASTMMDPDNKEWLAKPHYENYIKFTKEEEISKNKKNILEAYLYMGVYYMNHKEMCTAKPYFEKILALDPEDSNAKKFFASPEAKKCQ